MRRLDRFYIGGTWIDAAGNGHIDVINPATEEIEGRVAAANQSDVDAAVRSARRGFDDWSRSTVEKRLETLQGISDGLAERGEEIATVITREMGIPASMSYGYQVEPVLMVLADFINVLQAYEFEQSKGRRTILREPIGVCGLITPWNFPLTQIAGKLFPALAAGCSVVLKPSEIAPSCAVILAEVIDGLGLPPGVFNLINGHGPEAGMALAAHPDVDMVSLTGSTRAGVSVAKAAADSIKRVTLELGGKSPNIICDDANLEETVAAGVRKCFSNSGQCCDAPTRMLVPAALQSDAVDIAKAIAEQMCVGDPQAPDTDLGPVANRTQFDRVTGLIRKGIEEGAKLVTGGPERPDGLERGFYVRPTVFAEVDSRMTIAQEEIFGPVLCIISYRDEDDAVRIANDSRYGLTAFLATGDPERANRIARRLRAGQVRTFGAAFDSTAPFGGYKMSGIGREFGVAGLEEYLETKACMGL